MTWALVSEPPRFDHISPIPVTRVVRGKKSLSLVSYRSPLANSCSPKSKFYFTKRTSSPLAKNSSRRTIVHPIQNILFGELKFTIGERSSRRTSSRRTLVRGGWFSSRERIFWRTVRQFAAEYGRTRANPGELRRTPANVRRTPANVRRSSAECRCWRTDGEFARSSREFARVRGERQFAGYTALKRPLQYPVILKGLTGRSANGIPNHLHGRLGRHHATIPVTTQSLRVKLRSQVKITNFIKERFITKCE